MNINEEFPIKINLTHCGECNNSFTGQDKCPLCYGLETGNNKVYYFVNPVQPNSTTSKPRDHH